MWLNSGLGEEVVDFKWKIIKFFLKIKYSVIWSWSEVMNEGEMRVGG